MHGMLALPGGVAVPAKLLWGLLAVGGLVAVVLVLLANDGRQRRMTERVSALAAMNSAAPARAHSIRRPQETRSPLSRLLRRLLNVPAARPKVGAAPVWLFVLIGAACGGIASFLLRVFVSPPISALGGGVVALVTIRGLFQWDHDRYAAKLLRQLPDMVQMLMSAVRVGMPVSETLAGAARDMASPTREEFVQVCDEMSLGAGADAAILDLHRRTGLSEYGILAVTMAVQSRSGGRLAETLQNLAETTRQRVALVARAKALAGEAKVSAIALCLLPFIAAVAASFLQPGYLDALFFTKQGQPLAAGGFGSLVVGVLVMRHMVKQVEKP
jgi:tight adherence protein B